MSTINGTSYLPSYLNIASSAYASPASSLPSLAQVLDQDDSSNGSQDATTLDLSDQAKAYLAQLNSTAQAPTASLETTAANARAWFDQQYESLNVSSALVDGQTTVDLSSQSRESLEAVASNAQNLFSTDEQSAATTELGSRFEDAMSPYVAIARNTGNFTSLYQAASDYLDQAGSIERGTKSWQDQKQAIVTALAAVKADPSKAPDTGDANDPVRALLDKQTATGSTSDATASDLAANARAMLDDQANQALDNGTELTLDPTDKSGQLVDFSGFDNRTLAVMSLNTDSLFSDEEVRAAKNELNSRTRDAMMNIMNTSSDPMDMNLGLIGTYENMSDEEKSALGVTDDVTNRLIQNYITMQSLQSSMSTPSLAGSIGAAGGNTGMLGISALLGAQEVGSSDSSGSASDPTTMGLAGLM